jgi:hypothetical protein
MSAIQVGDLGVAGLATTQSLGDGGVKSNTAISAMSMILLMIHSFVSLILTRAVRRYQSHEFWKSDSMTTLARAAEEPIGQPKSEKAPAYPVAQRQVQRHIAHHFPHWPVAATVIVWTKVFLPFDVLFLHYSVLPQMLVTKN